MQLAALRLLALTLIGVACPRAAAADAGMDAAADGSLDAGPCEGVVCADGLMCNAVGVCTDEWNHCRTRICTGGRRCVPETGECVDHPCEGVSCPPDEACRAGECEPSCATTDCGPDERCESGRCVVDRCARVTCPGDELCDPASGRCAADACATIFCPPGRICDGVTGSCGDDPCPYLWCPEGQLCVDGECTLPSDVDAGGGDDAESSLDAGSGDCCESVPPDAEAGCGCRTTRPANESTWIGLLLGAVWLRARRSRRSLRPTRRR